MKSVLILQAWGLGDVIWSQSIAHHFIRQGYNVIWPVKNEYFEGLVNAYPRIQWVPDSLVKPETFNIKEKIILDDMLVAPIRWSDSFMKTEYKHVMRAKYDMYDLPWQTWRNHAAWVRNFGRELELFNLLGLKSGDKYNVINTRFGSSRERNIDITCTNGFNNVELKVLDGFSLFDWTKVLLGAAEIHTVSTSLLYILEMLPLVNPIHIYTRKPLEKDLSFVKFIFTKPYILH